MPTPLNNMITSDPLRASRQERFKDFPADIILAANVNLVDKSRFITNETISATTSTARAGVANHGVSLLQFIQNALDTGLLTCECGK